MLFFNNVGNSYLYSTLQNKIINCITKGKICLNFKIFEDKNYSMMPHELSPIVKEQCQIKLKQCHMKNDN